VHAPKLSGKKIEQLAEQFSSRIRERELSMANLQVYLISCESQPSRTVDDIERWVKEMQEAQDRRVVARVVAARDDRRTRMATTSESDAGVF
jgi:hypothetical protein